MPWRPLHRPRDIVVICQGPTRRSNRKRRIVPYRESLGPMRRVRFVSPPSTGRPGRLRQTGRFGPGRHRYQEKEFRGTTIGISPS